MAIETVCDQGGEETCGLAVTQEIPNRKPFLVHITESYHRSVIVWAKNPSAAMSDADTLCDAGEIDFERNCYAGREINVEMKARAEDFSQFAEYALNQD